MFRLPTPREFHRFVDKIDRSDIDGCWPWSGACNVAGYGQFYLDGRLVLSHRLSLQWLGGVELGQGQFSCHHCDNPPCVNPAHLFAGSPRDNARDMVAKGRHRSGDGGWTSTLNHYDRALAVLMREQGRTADDIADYFGLSRQSLARELVKYDPEELSHEDLFTLDVNEMSEDYY